jgi:hypothetical protein
MKMIYRAKIHSNHNSASNYHETIDVEIGESDIHDVVERAMVSEDAGLRDILDQLRSLDENSPEYNETMEELYETARTRVCARLIDYWNSYSDQTTCACGVKPKIELLEEV